MTGWNVRSKVVLREEFGSKCIEFVSFQFKESDYVLAEIELYVLNSDALISEICEEHFIEMGCEGLGKMLKDVFGGCMRMDMLNYLSRKTGKMKSVKRIYRIENIWFDEVHYFDFLFPDFIYRFGQHVFENKGVLIFGFYPLIWNVFEMLRELGFRDITELDSRFGNKVRSGWDVGFEMFLSE